MYDGDESRIPIYWTKSPTRFAVWPTSDLVDKDISVLSVLDNLPKGIPARGLLYTFWCEDSNNAVLGMFFLLPRLSLYTTSSDLIFFYADLIAIMNPDSNKVFKNMLVKR